MLNTTLSIQVSLVVILAFFLAGLVVSFVLFFLGRISDSFPRHNNKVDVMNKVDDSNRIETISENASSNKTAIVEMFEVKTMSLSETGAGKEEILVEKQDDKESDKEYEKEKQFQKTSKGKIRPMRAKLEPLDLSKVRAKYMLYDKKNSLYKNFLVKSNKPFLGYHVQTDNPYHKDLTTYL